MASTTIVRFVALRHESSFRDTAKYHGAVSYPPYGYQGYPGYPLRPPDHPQATTVMVLGIISLVGGFLCLVPLLLGPVAWVMGHRARREVELSGGMLGGRGNLLAGMICGIVATAILCLAVLVYGGIILFAIIGSH